MKHYRIEVRKLDSGRVVYKPQVGQIKPLIDGNVYLDWSDVVDHFTSTKERALEEIERYKHKGTKFVEYIELEPKMQELRDTTSYEDEPTLGQKCDIPFLLFIFGVVSLLLFGLFLTYFRFSSL